MDNAKDILDLDRTPLFYSSSTNNPPYSSNDSDRGVVINSQIENIDRSIDLNKNLKSRLI